MIEGNNGGNEKVDNTLDRIDIGPLYDSLQQAIDSLQDIRLTPDGFNKFCASVVRASVAQKIIDDDPATFPAGTKKPLGKLQKVAREVRDSHAGENLDEVVFEKEIMSKLESSPFLTIGEIATFFRVEYKVVYRAVMGYRAMSEKEKSYPAYLPSYRVGGATRIPAAAVFLWEGVGRAHLDTPEMQAFRERLAQGDLSALDVSLGSMIHDVWSKYVTQQGLSVERRLFLDLTSA